MLLLLNGGSCNASKRSITLVWIFKQITWQNNVL
jgi:hypothetical protein